MRESMVLTGNWDKNKTVLELIRDGISWDEKQMWVMGMIKKSESIIGY